LLLALRIYTHMRVSANVNSFLSAPGAQRRMHLRKSAIVNNFLYAPDAQAADRLQFAKIYKKFQKILQKNKKNRTRQRVRMG